MTEWQILAADGLEQAGQDRLRQAAQLVDGRNFSQAEIQELLRTSDALIVRSRTQVTASLLENAPRLRIIGRAGVGVDNIDLEAARQRSILVVNTPTATSLAVIELTLGMLLALARGLTRADASMKAGQWLKKELIGVEISGKTLGVIGLGNIGAGVAQRASALGMTIIGYDPYLSDEIIADRGARPASLEQIWLQAEFLTIHVPLSETTRGMIGATAFEMMKPGVRLVCTARGGIIDEPALLAALQAGQVAGAALDVFSQEPPGASPLVMHPLVIATPHIGAQTYEAQERAGEEIALEVLAGLRGLPLRWRVV